MKHFRKHKLKDVLLVRNGTFEKESLQALGNKIKKPIIVVNDFDDFKSVSFSEVQKLIDKARLVK